MADAANILEVGRLNPDFMGFIFYRKSARCVSKNFRIPGALSDTIRRVGVFVNQPGEEILQACRIHGLSYAQLHGGETPGLCSEMKAAGLGVIKAFGIDEHFDFATLAAFVPVVDYFLFDSGTRRFGGSGQRFEWKLLKKYSDKTPFFLSGGIGPAQIDDAMSLGMPQLIALDINSAVEIEPGLKDPGKVNQVLMCQRQRSNEIVEQ